MKAAINEKINYRLRFVSWKNYAKAPMWRVKRLRLRGGGNLKAPAFTLAEVLVTLGIIGVVSAMTVPSLMQNYQRQSYVTQLHKVYNELSQILVRYQNDKNALNLFEAGLNSTAAIQNMLTSYTKVIANCDKVV